MKFWMLYIEFSNLIFYIVILILAIRKKSYRDISTLIAGAIFGIMLEYVNVFVTQCYEYSKGFIFQVGKEPFNIPITIGLAWGLLLKTSHDITECFDLPIFIRTIFEAAFVVSVDLFGDVVSVRLDGGFWIWANFQDALTVTNTHFIGIPYQNFYGWYFVIFFSSLLLHVFDKKFQKTNSKNLIIRTISCIIGSEMLLMISLILLLPILNFIWLLFLIIYFGSIITVIIYFISKKIHKVRSIQNYFPLVYYGTLYLYTVIALISLGFVSKIPLFFILDLFYFIGVMIFIFKLTYNKKLN